jgi:putative restriction endonuclease
MLKAHIFAEGAHIRPLGAPHDGPDSVDNILCLCPNDHVRLDYGAMVIDEDLMVRDAVTWTPLGPLRIDSQHPIGREHVRYHRVLFSRHRTEGT